MTARPSSAIVPDTDADFHAVAWVRVVRDHMYADTSTLSSAELIDFVRHAAIAATQSADTSSADTPTA